MPPAKFRLRIAGGVCNLTHQANVLGELHVHMRVGLGVVEQHPVLACLLDHARVQVVQLCQLLGRFCVSANHACEERLRIVAVARDKVDSPRGGDACNGGPEAHLITNESAQFSNFLSDNPNARNGSGGMRGAGRTPMGSLTAWPWPWACSSWANRRCWRGSVVRPVRAAVTAVLRSDCIV
jgi:hypothetical protein